MLVTDPVAVYKIKVLIMQQVGHYCHYFIVIYYMTVSTNAL